MQNNSQVHSDHPAVRRSIQNIYGGTRKGQYKSAASIKDRTKIALKNLNAQRRAGWSKYYEAIGELMSIGRHYVKLDQSIQNGIPNELKTQLQGAVHFIERLQQDCTICYDDHNKLTAQNVFITPCGHLYHEQCIKEWTKNHSTCPFCRTELNHVV